MRFNLLRRRNFIALLGAATAAWPLAARAQRPDRMRRIGVLMGYEEDPETRTFLTAFRQALSELGWSDGHNVRIDDRWAAGQIDRMRALAREVAELQPAVILASTTPVVAALMQETRMIPIVFVNVADPIGSKFIESWTRPGGNVTGTINVEPSMTGKWLETLKETAPNVARVGLLFNPDTAPYVPGYYLPSFKAAAATLAIEPIDGQVRGVAELEGTIAAIADHPDSGLLVLPDTFTLVNRGLIVTLANRYRLPAIYPYPSTAKEGGLIAYGSDLVEQYRRVASYVDRILKGANPGEIPVQGPTKYTLIINLKTAKTLGLAVSPSLLARADEVIE